MLTLYIFILMFTNALNSIRLQETKINSIFINRITILTLLISILLNFNILYFNIIGKGIGIFSGLFQITWTASLIELLLLIVCIFILLSWPYVQNLNNLKSSSLSITNSDHYSLIALFSILGGSLLMSSLDLLSMYLSIELQSFALYILATLDKNRLSSAESGLKYFLLGSLSSTFILLGAAIVYTFTGLTQFESLNALISVPLINIDNNITQAFIFGIVLILVGFFFKISAAPFHQWAPDVYDGTPTIVTVWLTIIAKLTIFVFLLGLLDFSFISSLTNYDFSSLLESSINLYNSNFIIKNLLLLGSLLSLIVGTIAGLSQIKIKRLLALSSVSHVGFLLLALGIFSQKSLDSFIFYLIQYSITSLNIFLILLAFGYVINNITRSQDNWNVNLDLNYLVELKGLINSNRILSISLAICLFSMAGIPPLVGFFSKQFVLFSSIESGANFISIVAILVSVISASYYLKLIRLTFFSTPENKEIILNENINENINANNCFQAVQLSSIQSYLISVLTLMIFFFFLNPSLLLNGTQLVSLIYFNF